MFVQRISHRTYDEAVDDANKTLYDTYAPKQDTYGPKQDAYGPSLPTPAAGQPAYASPPGLDGRYYDGSWATVSSPPSPPGTARDTTALSARHRLPPMLEATPRDEADLRAAAGASPPPSPPTQLPAIASIVPPTTDSYPSCACRSGLDRSGDVLRGVCAASSDAVGRGLMAHLPSQDAGPPALERLPQEWYVLRRFIWQHCVLEPGSLHHHLLIEDWCDPEDEVLYRRERQRMQARLLREHEEARRRTLSGDHDVESRSANGAPRKDALRDALAHVPKPMPVEAGFREPLYEWCRQEGLGLPALDGQQWAEQLPDGVQLRDAQRMHYVLGLRWRRERQGAPHRLSATWLLTEAAVVVVQVSLFVCAPLVIGYYALDALRIWATLLCVPDDDAYGTADARAQSFTSGGAFGGARSCADLAAFAPLDTKLFLLGDSAVLPLISMLLLESFLISLAATLRLLLGYLNPSHLRGSWRTLRHGASVLFGALLLLHLLLVFSAVGMFAAWHLLATFRFPERLLRQTAALAALLYVACSIGQQMLSAAALLRQKLHVAFLDALQPALRLALRRSQTKLRLRRAAAGGKHLSRATRDEDIDATDASVHLMLQRHPNQHAPEREWREHTAGGVTHLIPPAGVASRALGPGDIYLLLAGDGSRPLEPPQFRALFEALQLPLSLRQKEVLFSQVEMPHEYVLERRERRKQHADLVLHRRDRRQHCSAWLLECLDPPTRRRTRGHEDSHAEVSPAEFHAAWQAVEQEVLLSAAAATGVSSTMIVLEVLGGLTLVGFLLLVVALGAESFGVADTDEFGALLQAAVVASCALAVVALRPRSEAEQSYARHAMDALVRRLIERHLEQAHSDSA